MKALDRVAQRWTVGLAEDSGSDLDDIVWANAYKEPVERGMMEAAEGQSVVDLGRSAGMGIGNDVGGVEQLVVSKATECALMSVGVQDELTEGALMQTPLYKHG